MIDTLKFEMLTNHIGQLTLNQPSRRNALNAAMWANLPNLLNELSNLKDLRVLIVTGEGQHFSSGADISEFATLYATKESANKISASIANALQALASFPIPTIAVIRGACVGGGCGLALCCDIRFADSTSKFAITPAKLGLAYPYADVQRGSLRVSPAKTLKKDIAHFLRSANLVLKMAKSQHLYHLRQCYLRRFCANFKRLTLACQS